MAPDPARPKNTYIREDKLLPHLPALHLLLTTPAHAPLRVAAIERERFQWLMRDVSSVAFRR